MFGLFNAFARLTAAANAFANTLEDANGRMQECIGQRPPVDVVPEPLPAPEPDASGNGHDRKKAKAKA